MNAANPDRRGWPRGSGYRRLEFRYCFRCFAIEQPPVDCPECGGYGEVPVQVLLPAPVESVAA